MTLKYAKLCLAIVAAILLGAVCVASLPAAQVADLPQDQCKWHLSIVGEARDPVYNKLVLWFDAHTELRRLRNQTHYHVVNTKSRVFELYRKHTPKLPCLRLQQADGTTVYECTAGDIPPTADSLLDSLNSKLCPNGQCFRRPKQKPTPEPVKPDVIEDTHGDLPAQPLEHVGPPEAPAESRLPIAAVAAIGVVGAVAGIGIGIRRNRRKL
jgi:hypothetical protein